MTNNQFGVLLIFIGMCLIVGSGLYIIFRENVKDKLVVGKTTLRT